MCFFFAYNLVWNLLKNLSDDINSNRKNDNDLSGF